MFENNLNKVVTFLVPLFIAGFFTCKALYPAQDKYSERYESINDIFSFCVFVFTNLYVHVKLYEC